MPLIIICGYPCCGKTIFAKYLASKLAPNNVTIINEESESLSKREGYKSSFAEKNTRSVIKSALNMAINAKSYVIVDSINYIKGYRYELYCITRSLQTPHCVCWIESNEESSTIWNKLRVDRNEDSYDEEILKDLRLRFESPNEKNRWDCPLFRIFIPDTETLDLDLTTPYNKDPQQEVSQESSNVEKENPLPTLSSWKKKNIATAVAQSKTEAITSPVGQNKAALSFSGTVPVSDHVHISPSEAVQQIQSYFSSAAAPSLCSSTVSVPRVDADRLYTLDRVSQDIVQLILRHQQQSPDPSGSAPLLLPDYDRSLSVHRPVGAPELHRIRRQFVKSSGAAGAAASEQRLGAAFVDYLAGQL